MIEIQPAMLLLALLLACIIGGGLGLWLATVLIEVPFRRAFARSENFKPAPGKDFDPMKQPDPIPFPGGSAGEKPPLKISITDTFERTPP